MTKPRVSSGSWPRFLHGTNQKTWVWNSGKLSGETWQFLLLCLNVMTHNRKVSQLKLAHCVKQPQGSAPGKRAEGLNLTTAGSGAPAAKVVLLNHLVCLGSSDLRFSWSMLEAWSLIRPEFENNTYWMSLRVKELELYSKIYHKINIYNFSWICLFCVLLSQRRANGFIVT